jgi:uncharacterized protein YraI
MRIIHLVAGAIMGAVLCAPGIAAAANAFTTGNVNMRAGPSTQFPRVTTLPAGVTVDVYGCLSGWSWCDTGWRGWRGWVSGIYLEQMYQGRRVLVPDYGARVGLPVISFHFGSYWDRWYSDRPWYRDRPRWRSSWERGDWSWRDRDRDWDRDWRRDRDRDRDRVDDRWRRSDRGDAEVIIRRSGDGDWSDGGRRGFRAESSRDWRPRDAGRDRAGRRANDDVPRGIRKRSGKGCPPGLAKQGRC